MASDLNCTIRWALFGIRNHINPKTHPTQSQTNNKKQQQRYQFHQLVHTSCAIAPLRQFDYLKLNRL